jgi:predicted amino acid dehydrogenase
MLTDLLSLIFNRNLSKRKIEFAFVVHPRNTYDIFRKYKFLKIFPKVIVDLFLLIMWPTYGGSIKVENPDKSIKWGAIVISPLTGKQMLKHRWLAAYRVYLSAKLAKIYGSKIVGLGALTSVVTDGGVYVSSRLKELHFTSGNGLTAATTANDILRIIKDKNITGPISIIGATGSIGKGITKVLDESCENYLILIGKNKERTNDLGHELLRKNIICTTDIEENNKAEIVIVTTSADGAIIDHHLLKNTKIIYDITQPKNTPEHIITGDDIMYIDGGLIQLPENIKVSMDISLPKGIAFSCLSETLLLAISEKYNLKSEKDLKFKNIKELSKLAIENSFNSYLIQNGNK